MRVALTGATGFVGRALSEHLAAAGHEPLTLQRRAPGREGGGTVRLYDPLEESSVAAALEGAEAVVNLAGENLLGGRWTRRRRALLRSSRVKTTQVLVAALGALEVAPAVLVSASAVGFYGPRGPQAVCGEEERSGAEDFLGRLCRDWEEAARAAQEPGVRVVVLRLGLVVGSGGGGLKKMERPFKLGLGGRVASGRQIVSWIHLRDLCRLIEFCLQAKSPGGTFNATAPEPLENRAFTRALAQALGRPALLPVPAWILRALFGAASVVLTTGQRALPRAALQAGFSFCSPTLPAALEAIYRPPEESPASKPGISRAAGRRD